jgi:hypothetical protein
MVLAVCYANSPVPMLVAAHASQLLSTKHCSLWNLLQAQWWQLQQQGPILERRWARWRVVLMKVRVRVLEQELVLGQRLALERRLMARVLV